jgi:hypothetical protein
LLSTFVIVPSALVVWDVCSTHVAVGLGSQLTRLTIVVKQGAHGGPPPAPPAAAPPDAELAPA